MAFLNTLKTFFSKSQDKLEHKVTGKWSIGIYTGTSPVKLSDPAKQINPVLSAKDIRDASTNFVADPFMVKEDDTWYMFFEVEVLENDHKKGKIGLATSTDGFHWHYENIILEESFHLSYPYVFKHQGQYYMIPETRAIRSVRLYKALDFPFQWKFETTLLQKKRFADASIFQYNDLWWMFTDSGHTTLRLYYAKDLDAPWQEHPKSPVVKKNLSFARPGGRVISFNGQLIRYAQDCYPYYGRQVWAFQITELTPKIYKETLISESPVITGTGTGWNKFGMHTIDPHPLGEKNWIACVDGFGDDQ